MPTIGEDGTWKGEVEGRTYKFREAKRREEREARRAALAEDETDPDVPAHLLAIVTQRKTDAGWEPITVSELEERSSHFTMMLLEEYARGVKAILDNIKKLSKPTAQETSATGKSENLVTP